jgi:hypothetical protein
MRHAADSNELFEVAGDELRAIVGDDPQRGLGKLVPRPLQDEEKRYLTPFVLPNGCIYSIEGRPKR